MREKQESIPNWEDFETQNEDRLKIENGKKYELGFSSIRQDSMEVEEKEKTAEGMVPVKKIIPTLILGIDYRDEKPVKMELVVTSKRLAQVIRTYFQKNMLFTRFFELTREGEGLHVKYQLIALDNKPIPRVSGENPAPADVGKREEPGAGGKPPASNFFQGIAKNNVEAFVND